MKSLHSTPPVAPAGKRSSSQMPSTAMPLPEIEEKLSAFAARVEDGTVAYFNEVLYDMAGEGLMLLKAQAHYALRAQVDTISIKSRKRTRSGQLAASDDGFAGWMRRLYCAGDLKTDSEKNRFFLAKQRTAYRRMQLAVNVGLTSDSTVEEIEQMRARKALHGKKPGDFLKGKLPLAALPVPREPEQLELNLFAQSFAVTSSALDELVCAVDTASPDEYEIAWRHLQSVLERLTGCAWEMTDKKPSIDGIEHGSMIDSVPTKKKKVPRK